jgi:hypothetical protein
MLTRQLIATFLLFFFFIICVLTLPRLFCPPCINLSHFSVSPWKIHSSVHPWSSFLLASLLPFYRLTDYLFLSYLFSASLTLLHCMVSPNEGNSSGRELLQPWLTRRLTEAGSCPSWPTRRRLSRQQLQLQLQPQQRQPNQHQNRSRLPENPLLFPNRPCRPTELRVLRPKP